MKDIITGIQQVGIGVTDAHEAKLLYKELFGMDVLVFDDRAQASLMTQYTGSTVHDRRAILSLNMNGGGGFEIWQFTSRNPTKPAHAPQPGDLGIFAVKIKARDVKAAHEKFKAVRSISISPIYDTPDDRLHFWLTDSYGNHFNIVEGDEWFKTSKSTCGGVVGAVIGVSDMEKALHFYRDVLGIDQVVYSGTAPMIDVPDATLEGQMFKRVLLKKQVGNRGAFSKLLGAVQIELVEVKERVPEKIYADRYWGDCGFIHLCFDVLNMDTLKNTSTQCGYPFTVDSANSFSMGSSAGRFCYVEDPDGTLIELVETHKVPIFKKLGLYLNLRKRKNDKPLPGWMIGMMALSKVR
jgi:catechol 2,3-dioxygenase-like lactoylglutathione lyase family enzyme